MATEIYLGNPPQYVIDWIRNHSQPSELGIPLYFEGQEPGATVAMIAWNDNMFEPEEHLQCHLESSTDGMSTWQAYDGEVISLDECTGNRVYFRAPEGQPNTDGLAPYDENYGGAEIFHAFKVENAVKAGGNIQFLLESTGTRTDVPAYAFLRIFGWLSYDEKIDNYVNWCASLTQAPSLPATTLADNCYFSMFANCESLTQAPSLPATTLADNCCSYMFSGCTSLTQAPSLPATTLADNCYFNMFSDCTSLTQAPSLPAMTLANNCYFNMFSSCTHLASMDVSFTAWNPSTATINWMYSTGSQAEGTKTFTCPADLPNESGVNRIPFGWTRIEK